MKTRNDCEIAFDCVKRANVVLPVGPCEEIFARKHTATHKPTSAQPLSAPHSDQRDIHTYIHTRINRLWSPLAYGLGGNNHLSLPPLSLSSLSLSLYSLSLSLSSLLSLSLSLSLSSLSSSPLAPLSLSLSLSACSPLFVSLIH